MKLFIHTACMVGAKKYATKKKTDRFEVNWPMIMRRIMSAVNKSGLGEEPSLKIIRNHVGDLYTRGYDEYFNKKRYPHIINRQVGTLQEYEFPTLQMLHDYAVLADPDEPICYIHTKGASHLDNYKTKKWRRRMLNKTIENYKVCLEALESFDAVGPQPTKKSRCYFRGNFWWAKAGFIAEQKRPSLGLKHDSYPPIQETGSSRYGAEHWLLYNCKKTFGQKREFGEGEKFQYYKDMDF